MPAHRALRPKEVTGVGAAACEGVAGGGASMWVSSLSGGELLIFRDELSQPVECGSVEMGTHIPPNRSMVIRQPAALGGRQAREVDELWIDRKAGEGLELQKS